MKGHLLFVPVQSLICLSCLLAAVTAGYSQATLVPLVRLIKGLFFDSTEITMIEFGNQEVHDKVGMFYPPYIQEGFYSSTFPTKYFFEHMGLKHTSVDLNGFDGSLRLDCRQDLTGNLDKADVITNIGFSEHVGEGDVKDNIIRNQYTIFKNMHDLGKVGTLYYHNFVANFPRHGVVNYGLEFIYALPKKSNYILLFEPYRSLYDKYDDGTGEEIIDYVAAFRKVKDEPFMTFEEFKELPGLNNIFDQYGLYRRVTVQISGAKTRNGELVPVFEVNQVLHAEKSFEEWAEVFCQEYFSVHAADPSGNAFLINALDLKYCVAITLYSLEMSSIEHGIRQ